MTILIAYDVNNEAQTEVKNALLINGFSDIWYDSSNKIQHLPDTTLIRDNLGSPVDAKGKFFNVIDELNKKRKPENKIEVTKFIATQSSGIVGL